MNTAATIKYAAIKMKNEPNNAQKRPRVTFHASKNENLRRAIDVAAAGAKRTPMKIRIAY